MYFCYGKADADGATEMSDLDRIIPALNRALVIATFEDTGDELALGVGEMAVVVGSR
jgi:hypothetical protein